MEAGESLEIESFDDRTVLRLNRSRATMRKELGVLVFDTAEPITASVVLKTVEKIRSERSDQAAGIEH